jgi:AraC-like DNA-binding protein
MKVVSFNVPKTSQEAFRFQSDEMANFYDQLHQHPELQIMYILKGEGTLIAGDYVGRFGPTDLYLIGSRQPHVFRNDERYYQKKKKGNAKAISLYIHERYVGETFWNLDELKTIREFIKIAGCGFNVFGKTKIQLIDYIQQLKVERGIDKLVTYLKMLQLISTSKELLPLSVASQYADTPIDEGKRMNDILNFTFKESHRKIYLREVAEIAHLSTEAFCRYFKLHTLKTYTTFLNEVRVSNACKLLLNPGVSIQEVCYQSGFQNISNFNRIFKRITGKAPSNYLT